MNINGQAECVERLSIESSESVLGCVRPIAVRFQLWLTSILFKYQILWTRIRMCSGAHDLCPFTFVKSHSESGLYHFDLWPVSHVIAERHIYVLETHAYILWLYCFVMYCGTIWDVIKNLSNMLRAASDQFPFAFKYNLAKIHKIMLGVAWDLFHSVWKSNRIWNESGPRYLQSIVFVVALPRSNLNLQEMNQNLVSVASDCCLFMSN